MPRSSHSKIANQVAREYLVRMVDGRDYARDPDLQMCKNAANGLGAGAYIIALDEQLIPFGKPVYTVPDETAPAEPKPIEIVAVTPEPEADEVPLSPQAQAVVENAKAIKSGGHPRQERPGDGTEPAELLFLGGCACGCGEETEGIKSGHRKFVQGHDQRLIGVLVEAWSASQTVRWITKDAGEFVVGSALDYGARVFSDFGLSKLQRALGKPQTSVRASKPNQTATPVVASDAGMGDEIKVKIGRHERYARVHGMNQAGKVTAVRYTTKQDPGNEIVTEKFVVLD